MAILLDIEGTLISREKMLELAHILFLNNFMTSKDVSEMQEALQNKDDKKLEKIANRCIERALKTEKGRNLLRTWIKTAFNVQKTRAAIKKVQQAGEEVYINTTLHKEFGKIVAEEIGAKGVRKRKYRTKSGEFYIDNKLKEFKKENPGVRGIRFQLRTLAPKNQIRLETYGLKMYPEDVADLLNILSEQIKEKKIEKTKPREKKLRQSKLEEFGQKKTRKRIV